MKIDLNNIDPEQFNLTPCLIAGEECLFINPPHIGTKWQKNNLILRSSIWNSQGELISSSFKKFFNWSEQSDLVSIPNSLNNVKLMEKVDGSTLVLSKYKGELIVRTRGSLRPENMAKAGHEIEILKNRYPQVFDFTGENTADFSMIYEWVSPSNKIVINYVEPDIYLIGMISHEDYSYVSQLELDDLAKELKVKRPRQFNFGSFDEMFAAIHALDFLATTKKQSPQEILINTRAKEQSELSRDFEGFCVYFNKDQEIRKIKSAWYLAMHKLKSELSSIDKVIDLWATLDHPEYSQFIKYIEDNFDWEIAQMCRPFSSKICDGYKEVKKIIEGMERFVEPLKTKTRKEAALAIQAAYGTTNRAGFCFKTLDSRPLSRDDTKKLLYQTFK